MRRAAVRGVLTAVAIMAASPAMARDVYIKLQPVVLELWDANGVFHLVNMELTVAFPTEAKLNKAISVKIQQVLQTLPYEELTKPSGGATIKAMAMDVIRKEPDGILADEVLIQKLMFR